MLHTFTLLSSWLKYDWKKLWQTVNVCVYVSIQNVWNDSNPAVVHWTLGNFGWPISGSNVADFLSRYSVKPYIFQIMNVWRGTKVHSKNVKASDFCRSLKKISGHNRLKTASLLSSRISAHQWKWDMLGKVACNELRQSRAIMSHDLKVPHHILKKAHLIKGSLRNVSSENLLKITKFSAKKVVFSIKPKITP